MEKNEFEMLNKRLSYFWSLESSDVVIQNFFL